MFVYYGPDKLRFSRAFDPIAYPYADPLRGERVAPPRPVRSKRRVTSA
jgi:hypothetical protein